MVTRRSRSRTMRMSPQTPTEENRKNGPSELGKASLNWSQAPNWSQIRPELPDHKELGGSVWESNPPSWPHRTGSMALKATRITGPLSPPFEGPQRTHSIEGTQQRSLACRPCCYACST